MKLWFRRSMVALLAVVFAAAGLGQIPCTKSAITVTALTEKSILKRATKRPQPELPGGFGRIDAQIEVIVAVGTDGKVYCAQANEQSHPLLRKYCEDAARKWEFRLLKKGAVPVSFSGPIRFRIRR